MSTNPATPKQGGSTVLAPTHSAASSKGTALPDPPNQEELKAAKTKLGKARQAEAKKNAEVGVCRKALEEDQQKLDNAEAGLRTAQESLRAAQRDVDEQLTLMAEESLEIDGSPVTVFQGGAATFTTRRKYELDPKLVTISWEASGCPITGGQGTDTVTVDTSSVGAGDYDIRVSLLLSE